MKPHQNHISSEDIALIIQGKVDPHKRAEFFDHIRSCGECADALIDAAIYCEVPTPDLEHSDGALAIAAAGKDILPAAEAVSSGSGKVSGGFWSAGLKRNTALATAAGMILIIGIGLGNIWQRRSQQVSSSIASPVQEAIETLSSCGPIVLPGGEEGLIGREPVYRSGYVQPDGRLQASEDALYERYIDSSPSSEVTYWLLSVYVATNRTDIARDIAADAKKRFPDDARLAILDAIIAYIDEDFARSESVLRKVLRSHDGDQVARLNLAVVLKEQGERDEARSLLAQVVEEAPDTPLAGRAESIMADM